MEENLARWGLLLYEQAMPVAHTANVMKAWARVGNQAGRRFSVHVDAVLEAGASDADVKTAKEVATALLKVPWELLHNGEAYLFQGAKPTRVRRRLPNTKVFDLPVLAPPIRILLVTARPEDEDCGYIDHRTSALPLVEAMETLPGLVAIHVLSPPTLPALREALDRARGQNKPYHVVHFDGHGTYDKTVGLGGLCFELPEDSGKLEQRRHVTVFTDKLGPLLCDHRISLVFLEACQTAKAEEASESVASELLKVGVASVVAMSHSVPVETAKRFVTEFYQALAAGKRVGDAMLAGQRSLKDDTFRGRIFGADELRLEDWFVPVLFQEKDDPQLFKTTPAKQTVADFQAALATRLGALPPGPETGFVGRSRELLALQRLLRLERYAVVRGQGGEGKTALAAEFARWMVRSQQVRRAAFVSVETHSHSKAILDAIGSQLLPGYSVATFNDLDNALHPIEQVLTEQPTLLVVDNMESILLPPFIETPDALSEEARRELDSILQLCARLNAQGDTRLIYTSRERMPAPFNGARHLRELHQLDRADAVKLVERVLNAAGNNGVSGGASDAAREQIEQLVGAVHGHARTLTLLAPTLRKRGVDATRQSLVELMTELDQQIAHLPDNDPRRREKSVFASVELSLRRMTEANHERTRVLGVFHGGFQRSVLANMMEWEEADVGALASELIATGLATPNPYDHLTLNPALCPYLFGRMDNGEREALTARWTESMLGYVDYLVQQQKQKAEVAATLTVLELPNLFALLDLVLRAGDGSATVKLTTSLCSLLLNTGKPRLLERVGLVRDAATAALGNAWNQSQFAAAVARIEQQLNGGQIREAFESAQALLQRARAAGGQAYPDADYDLEIACALVGRMLQRVGRSEQALPLLIDARQRFVEAVAKERTSNAAEAMVAGCFAEQGNCLQTLGRLDEAAAAYEETIQRAEQLKDARMVAVGKGQLGTVRKDQRRYPEALAAYAEALERFTQLDELGSIALWWYQTGTVYKETGQPEAAEDAYRKSLATYVRLGNVDGQARTLMQLGDLYDYVLNRPEEAVAFFRQAADKYGGSRDEVSEGHARTNLGATLRKLRRFDEARQEIHRALECKSQLGHASEPWKTWYMLTAIETATGNPAAAAEAKSKANACYLAYRRDGGENHPFGPLCLALTQFLLAGNPAQAAALLQGVDVHPDVPGRLQTFFRALQAIVAGSRDRTLADAPDLDYIMAAEILFFIETLESNRLSDGESPQSQDQGLF